MVEDGYRPDVVIAIARGGLTVAGALAYALGVKNCGSMNVEFYTGIDERLDVPVVLPPTLDLVDVRGLRVLVADDVADTGHTLRLVREVLAQHVAEARTVVLYRSPVRSSTPTTLAGDRRLNRVPLVGAAPRESGPPSRAEIDRLLADLAALAAVGDTGDGGNCRLALTDDDAGGRELVAGWMRDLGLDVRVDRVGNVVATRAGADADLPGDDRQPHRHRPNRRPVRRHPRRARRARGRARPRRRRRADPPPARRRLLHRRGGQPLRARHARVARVRRGADLETALDTVGFDGAVLGDELERIGWAGDAAVPGPVPHAYVELHIEQGPVLEEAGVTIGAVTGVQGIHWEELTITGQSNHAGTTPMRLRHDAGYVAAEVAVAVRRIAAAWRTRSAPWAARLHPDLVNVVAATATLTIDLRHTDGAVLAASETGPRARSTTWPPRRARRCSGGRWRASSRSCSTTRCLAVERPRSPAGPRRPAPALGRRARRPDDRPHVPGGMVFVPPSAGSATTPPSTPNPTTRRRRPGARRRPPRTGRDGERDGPGAVRSSARGD